MKKFLMILALMFFAFPLLAQEGAVADPKSAYMFGLYCLGVGVAAAGCGIGQSIAAHATLEGIARNPSAANKLLSIMILAFALIESLVIFTIVTVFFLK